MASIENVGHGVIVEKRDDGITVFSVTEREITAMDTWAQNVIASSKADPHNVRHLHDLSVVPCVFNSAQREKIREVNTAVPDVKGRAAIVLHKSTFTQAMRLFMNTGAVRQQPGLKTKLFFEVDEALKWLSEAD